VALPRSVSPQGDFAATVDVLEPLQKGLFFRKTSHGKTLGIQHSYFVVIFWIEHLEPNTRFFETVEQIKWAWPRILGSKNQNEGVAIGESETGSWKGYI